jgi:hypothetical protein
MSMDVMYPDESSASGGTSSSSTGSLNGETNVSIETTTTFGTPLLPYGPVNMITKVITASTAFYDSPLLIMADAALAAVTVTLPPAGSGVGKLIAVMKTDSTGNTVTINAVSGETVYKLSSFSNLSSQYQAAMFIGIKFSSFNGWVKVA